MEDWLLLWLKFGLPKRLWKIKRQNIYFQPRWANRDQIYPPLTRVKNGKNIWNILGVSHQAAKNSDPDGGPCDGPARGLQGASRPCVGRRSLAGWGAGVGGTATAAGRVKALPRGVSCPEAVLRDPHGWGLMHTSAGGSPLRSGEEQNPKELQAEILRAHTRLMHGVHTLQDTREDPQRALLWEWEKLATDHVLLWFHQTFISWEDPKGSNLSKGLNCFPEQAFIRNRTWAMLSDAKIHVWSLTLERSGRRCNPDEIKIDQWKSTKNYTHHGVIKQGYKSSFYNCLPHMQGVRGQRDMPRENLQWKL